MKSPKNIPTKSNPLSDHERRLRRIAKAEQKFPRLTKITRHPKYGDWVPPAVAALEVGGGLLLGYLATKIIFSLPLPSISIPFPDITLPSLPLPHITLPNLPDLPAWLQTILYWVKKTLPIWIAVGFAIYAIRRKNKQT